MANSILLYKSSEIKQSDEFYTKTQVMENISSIGENLLLDKNYNGNPFIQLNDFPVFNHISINDNMVMNTTFISMNKVIRLLPNQTPSIIFNEPEFKRKLVYVKSFGDNIEYGETPVMYDPTNFEPKKYKTIRFASVELSDKEVEDIIIKNRYFTSLVPNSNKLFYIDEIISNISAELKLMETKNNLNQEEYSIYTELVNRLGMPKSKEIFFRWIDRITNNDKKENKNYMYTLIRRNGKYVR